MQDSTKIWRVWNTTLVMVSQSPRFCRESGQLLRNVVNFPLCGGFTTKFCINHSQRSNPNYLVPTHETTPTIATSPAPRANPVRDKFVERLEPDNAGIVKKPGIFHLAIVVPASLSLSIRRVWSNLADHIQWLSLCFLSYHQQTQSCHKLP